MRPARYFSIIQLSNARICDFEMQYSNIDIFQYRYNDITDAPSDILRFPKHLDKSAPYVYSIS